MARKKSPKTIALGDYRPRPEILNMTWAPAQDGAPTPAPEVFEWCVSS